MIRARGNFDLSFSSILWEKQLKNLTIVLTDFLEGCKLLNYTRLCMFRSSSKRGILVWDYFNKAKFFCSWQDLYVHKIVPLTFLWMQLYFYLKNFEFVTKMSLCHLCTEKVVQLYHSESISIIIFFRNAPWQSEISPK